jgi:CRP-like cAMP-binding protein
MGPELIDEVPLFRDAPRRVRSEATRWADELEAPAATVLVREGEYPREFYVIVEGTADVLRAGERIATLGPGEFFGELGLLDPKWRTASVVATSPMRLLVLAPREFRTMLAASPEIAAQIGDVAAQRA